MNLFELFQIIYATHFVLGIYLSLLLWRFVPAGMMPLFQQVSTPSEIIISATTSILSLCWYFAWYGSIVFALRGRFPVLSPRAFSILLGAVYTGFVIVNYAANEHGMRELLANNPFYAFTYGLILLVSACGAVLLPRLKIQFDNEQQRRAQKLEQRLDDLHPWRKSATTKMSREAENH